MPALNPICGNPLFRRSRPTARALACARIAAILLLSALLFLEGARAAEPPFNYQHDVMVPMRDGVRLAANIFLPKQGGKFPVILLRTPYGKGDQTFGDGKKYGARGYAVVAQDCRGRGDSEGVWEPFRYDVPDGFDTQQWIGRQPWCDGKIGTAGGSYVGWTQWAAAPNSSRYLAAMAPVVPFCNGYDLAYPGGAFQLALLFGWGALVGGVHADPGQWTRAYKFLPLDNWDSQFHQTVPYLHGWIAHPNYDEYWKARGIDDDFRDVTAPILNIGGWYDIFSKPTLEMIRQVRRQSKNRLARRNQFAVIGPWGHGVGTQKLGELDFGKAASLNLGELQERWFDYWLKDKETGVQDWPAYYLFVMGANRWRGEDQWPLRGTQFAKFYLHSAGDAGGRDSRGGLDAKLPGNEPPDHFVYDPSDPAPTRGGNNLFGIAAGPYDQSAIEQRPDVLVYSSAALAEPVEVTGPIQLILEAASSAPDTDFTGKLADVYPDGRAMNLCDGIVRARRRDPASAPSLIEPNRVYRYSIDLWVTSNVFKTGHRIRLEVSSSNFPRFDRNPNTGHPFGADAETRPARQSIFHDADRASYLVLPIIPRRGRDLFIE